MPLPLSLFVTAAAPPDPAAPASPRLSVVVPVKNEADNIVPLLDEIATALAHGPLFEAVYVNDGSEDETAAVLRTARAQRPWLVVLHHRTSCGQSRAIKTGVEAARGTLIATLDGDGQNDPADLPALLARHAQEGGGPDVMIAGHRVKRMDTASKRWTSRTANAIRARLLRDDTPDTGCGLKVFARATFLAMPYFDHMHRFLPALMIRQAGRVVSVPVNHRPRQRGTSNYGFWDRFWVSLADILGVMWLQRRIRHPDIVPDDQFDS